MQIKRSELFKKQFRNTVLNIAKDKKIAAKNFKNSLNQSIDNLPNFPYKFRQSIYHENESIRDMTFKGHTVIYKIYENHINIVEIFNKNLPQLSED